MCYLVTLLAVCFSELSYHSIVYNSVTEQCYIDLQVILHIHNIHIGNRRPSTIFDIYVVHNHAIIPGNLFRRWTLMIISLLPQIIDNAVSQINQIRREKPSFHNYVTVIYMCNNNIPFILRSLMCLLIRKT